MYAPCAAGESGSSGTAPLSENDFAADPPLIARRRRRPAQVGRIGGITRRIKRRRAGAVLLAEEVDAVDGNALAAAAIGRRRAWSTAREARRRFHRRWRLGGRQVTRKDQILAATTRDHDHGEHAGNRRQQRR